MVFGPAFYDDLMTRQESVMLLRTGKTNDYAIRGPPVRIVLISVAMYIGGLCVELWMVVLQFP